jgi:hypothetical protein
MTFSGKAMFGANLIHREVHLVRGDGLVGFRTEERLERFAHAYDLGVTADVCLLEGARLRVGYNAFWLVNVATAYGQIDYNLGNPAGRRDSSDTIFYHGPQIEVQFRF